MLNGLWRALKRGAKAIEMRRHKKQAEKRLANEKKKMTEIPLGVESLNHLNLPEKTKKK
jgi:hypothetical protein